MSRAGEGRSVLVTGATGLLGTALSAALRTTLDPNGFPDVFGGLAPTNAREVAAPDPALAESQVVQNARRSVIKVLGTAPSCSRRIEGSAGRGRAGPPRCRSDAVVAGPLPVTPGCGSDGPAVRTPRRAHPMAPVRQSRSSIAAS